MNGTASSAETTPTTATPILTEAMSHNLDQDKIQLRIDNETYLRRHPEIKGILQYFVKSVIHEKPEDIAGFASSLLSHPELKSNIKSFKYKAGAAASAESSAVPSNNSTRPTTVSSEKTEM